jgi:hypothetical protein
MNKDSWIALIIASIITMIASTPLYYSRGSKSKFSEGSDTKVTEPMNKTDQISGSTTVSEPINITDQISGSTTESTMP